jgi:hypothetical protein
MAGERWGRMGLVGGSGVGEEVQGRVTKRIKVIGIQRRNYRMASRRVIFI